MASNLGTEPFVKKLTQDDSIKTHLKGVFPKDTINNARFAVNFFTSIGLGPLTEDLREFLKDAPNILLEQKYQELLAEAQAANESSSSSSDSSSDSDSNSDSSSDSGSSKSKKSQKS